MNSPIFPDEILHLFVPTSTEPAAPSHVSSLAMQSEEEWESEPVSPPSPTTKKASASRKGKEKVLESPLHSPKSQHVEDTFE